MKPCPFCGGTPVSELESWVNPNGHSWGSGRYAFIKCSNCKAQSGQVEVVNFNMFSKHTVADFRESNLLRAIEDERYGAYVFEQQAKALELWTTRSNHE